MVYTDCRWFCGYALFVACLVCLSRFCFGCCSSGWFGFDLGALMAGLFDKLVVVGLGCFCWFMIAFV